eukprot:TRINITY_DN236_c0_g1_i1.p2 TRINITY_DN236_c0_g1~~TRINITY_DN236_c0_g1_i1.p2  ORF type:complete len:135 (-),score=19.44 TRINITY_DN236_c0_g1_i1:97-501(-)
MSEVTIRTRKFQRNGLLARKQMIVDVVHPNRANVSKEGIRSSLAKMYKVTDENTVFVYGMKTRFGGEKSTGFALIYDDVDSAKKFEPRYRLARQGLVERKQATRRANKKNKGTKLRTWGTGRRAAKHKAKRAEE